MKKNRNISSLIMALSFVSCSYLTSNQINDSNFHTIDKKNETNSSKQSQIEIYCWCFINEKNSASQNGETTMKVSNCNTWARVTPLELIQQNHLLISINDSDLVLRFKKIFYDSKKDTSYENVKTDSRFVILFKNTNSVTDTIIYRDNSTFSFNEKSVLKYTFDVMDSVRSMLNKKRIDCQSNFDAN